MQDAKETKLFEQIVSRPVARLASNAWGDQARDRLRTVAEAVAIGANAATATVLGMGTLTGADLARFDAMPYVEAVTQHVSSLATHPQLLSWTPFAVVAGTGVCAVSAVMPQITSKVDKGTARMLNSIERHLPPARPARLPYGSNTQ